MVLGLCALYFWNNPIFNWIYHVKELLASRSFQWFKMVCLCLCVNFIIRVIEAKYIYSKLYYFEKRKQPNIIVLPLLTACNSKL